MRKGNDSLTQKTGGFLMGNKISSFFFPFFLEGRQIHVLVGTIVGDYLLPISAAGSSKSASGHICLQK